MTTHRDTAVELEREIGRTRADIDMTLTAIQERLSPGRLLDQVLDYTKENGGAFAGNLGRSVRDNPLPVALLGIGLGWLMFGGRRHDGDMERYTGAPDYGYPVHSGEAVLQGEGIDRVGIQQTEYVGDAGADEGPGLLEAGKNKAREWTEGARHVAGSAGAGVRSARSGAVNAAARVRERARNATSSAGHFMEENPLVVGALAVAAGAALGALLPSTAREGQLMGEASRRVKEAIGDGISEMTDAARKGAAGDDSGSTQMPAGPMTSAAERDAASSAL